MIHRPPIPTLAMAVFLCLSASMLNWSCSKKKPTVQKKPGGVEEPAAPPDSLLGIGRESAGLVKMWVLALSVVETEESAATAGKRLEVISDQFDGLLDRAAALPKLSPEEFKRIDEEIEGLLGEAANGLEPERKRIFLLPNEVRSLVLPAHEELLNKFRDVSRTISASSQTSRTPAASAEGG